MTDHPVPADPPSPLTAEEAVEKALLYTFNWSDKQYAKMRGALTERAFIRALEQDGYTVATLDAARAPAPAGRGVRTECPLVGVHEHAFRGPHTFDEWYDGQAPAPAGLDVLADRIRELDAESARSLIDWRDLSPGDMAEALIRAATRPAEEARND